MQLKYSYIDRLFAKEGQGHFEVKCFKVNCAHTGTKTICPLIFDTLGIKATRGSSGPESVTWMILIVTCLIAIVNLHVATTTTT